VNGKPISHRLKKAVNVKPHIRTITMGITGKIQNIDVKKRTLRIIEVVNSANSEFLFDFPLNLSPPINKNGFSTLDKERNIKVLCKCIF